MRLNLGPPPSAFTPSPGWQALAEPAPLRLSRLGLLVGIAAAVGVATLWHIAGISYLVQFQALRGLPALATFLVGLVVLLAVHEAVHALLHPGFGASPHTVVGASRRPLLLYAAYLGTLRRERFVAILLGPLLLLSVLPALLCASGLANDLFSPMVAALSVMNAAASGVDVLGAGLILAQVPRQSVLQNAGWATYWRPGT